MIRNEILSNHEHFGFIKISGKNTKKFLDGQFSCNVLNLKKNTVLKASYVNAKGKIISSFMLFYNKENEYYIYINKDIINSTIKDLKKYSVFSNLKIEDYTNKFSCIILKKIFFKNIINAKTTMYKCNVGVFILGRKHVLHKLEKYLRKYFFLIKQSLREFNFRNFLYGSINLSLDNYYKYLPYDLNKMKYVDKKKGCFKGQEIIIRIKYKSILKKRISIFKINSRRLFNQMNSKIFFNNIYIGNITDYVFYNNICYISSYIKLNYYDNKKFFLNGYLINHIKYL